MLNQKSALQTRLATQVGQLRKNSTDPHGLNIEGLRVYAHVENQERLARGEPPFDCSVMTIDQFPQFLKQIEAEKDNLTAVNDPKRMQIIIRGTITHFAVVDLQLSKDPNECKAFLLDAANDARMYDIYRAFDYENKQLIQSGEEPLVSQITIAQTVKQGYGGGIQTRNQGCDLFSFDHAVELSKIDIHQYLSQTFGQRVMYKDGAKYSSIDWDKLPPQLMKNAQSMRLIADYRKLLTDDENRYLDQVMRIETITDKDGNTKSVNKTIDTVLETNGKKAGAFIDQADDTTLEEVIKSPIKQKAFKQVFTNYSGSDLSSSSSSDDESDDTSNMTPGDYELPFIEKLHDIFESPKFIPSQNDKNLIQTLRMMVVHAILIDENPEQTIKRLSKIIDNPAQTENLSEPLKTICKSIMVLEQNIDDPYGLIMIDSIYKKGYYVEKQSVTSESNPLDSDDSLDAMFRKIQIILQQAESVLEVLPDNQADHEAIKNLKMKEEGSFYGRQKPPETLQEKLQTISEASTRTLDYENISQTIESFCIALRDLTSDDPQAREKATKQLDTYYRQATTQSLEPETQKVHKM